MYHVDPCSTSHPKAVRNPSPLRKTLLKVACHINTSVVTNLFREKPLKDRDYVLTVFNYRQKRLVARSNPERADI